MTNGFCKFDCKLYQRGCAGNSDGYIKNCKEYDPEPPYYLISPQDLEIIYRGDSDSSSESYEETRKHPYNLQAELETVLELCVNERKKLTFDSSFATDNAYNEGRLSIIKIIEESLQQKDGDS